MWNKTQIEQHCQAVKLLEKIKDLALLEIKNKPNTSEWQVKEFILKKFKEFGMTSDSDTPIVAFRESTCNPRYFPKRKCNKLTRNSLIMLDIWARLKVKGAPYADLTWMAFYGNKIPVKVQNVFDIVIKARDKCVSHIKKELKKSQIPSGQELDIVCRDYITKQGYGKEFKHSTGHCIGFYSPHGNRGNLRKTNHKPILINVGYTIEPGIYLQDKFGIRSEIDFYVNKKKEVMVTCKVQKKIIKI